MGALDQAAPLAEWELPEEFATLRRLMEARMIKAGRREYVQVLRLLETFDMADLNVAVKNALRMGAIGFDAIKHLVLCQVEKRPPKLVLSQTFLTFAGLGDAAVILRQRWRTRGAERWLTSRAYISQRKRSCMPCLRIPRHPVGYSDNIRSVIPEYPVT